MTKTFIKRAIAAILAMLILGLCIPNSALAAEKYYTKSTKLKANKWGTAKSPTRYYDYWTGIGENNYQMLEITVPKDGYVTIKTKSTDGIYIAKAKKNKEPVILFELRNAKKYLRPLQKGSYYIYSSNSDVKVQYATTKVAAATNTSKAKAKKLTPSTNAIFAFYNNKSASRWYKITLTKKQYITFTLKLLDKSEDTVCKGFKLYDSKNNLVFEDTHLYKTTNKFKTTDKLAAGTYYIKIEHPKNYDNLSKLMQLSWK